MCVRTHTHSHHMQAKAMWQRPQTGGEDQFLTQCAADIHKIRPQRTAGEGWRGGGRWEKHNEWE